MTTKKLKESSAERFVRKLLGSPLTFGMAVSSLRLRDGISQALLAKRIGISKQYLCDVEKGRRQVSTEQAIRFARAFGDPPDLLVDLAVREAVLELQESFKKSGLKYKITVEAA